MKKSKYKNKKIKVENSTGCIRRGCYLTTLPMSILRTKRVNRSDLLAA